MIVTRFQSGIIVACSMLLSGCTVCQNAMRTMYHEPKAFSWKDDRPRSVELYRNMADQAWREELGHCPELLGEVDYAIGFRDGFVDFVYAGGNGEPPPIPPRQFWNAILRTPDGKRRADQWFAGYRHGARVARHGGYRELGIVHTSLLGVSDPAGVTTYASDAAGVHEIEPEEDAAPSEDLPEPSTAPNGPSLNTHDEAPDKGAERDSGAETESTSPSTLPSHSPFGDDAYPAESPADLPLPQSEPMEDASNPDRALDDLGSVGQPIAVASAIAACCDQAECVVAKIENDAPPAEQPISTIRLLAEPIKPAADNKSKIQVQLVPTPRGGGPAKTHPSNRAGDVILSVATDEVEPSNAPAESTIRLRRTLGRVTEPQQRVTVRRALPRAASSFRVMVKQ
jgi:hypothetical protein